MTISPKTGPIWRRLLAAGVFGALLAQMSLPALHAVATERHPLRGIPAPQLRSSSAPAIERATRSAPAAHDPATCSICQSLMRTNPVAMTSLSRGEPCPRVVSALPMAPECAHSAAVQSGHPPRAPPAPAFHLA